MTLAFRAILACSVVSLALGTPVWATDPLPVNIIATANAKMSWHVAVFTRLGSNGKVTYRAGCAWAGDGNITTSEQWLKYLEKQAAK